jgi:hypothetical protein
MSIVAECAHRTWAYTSDRGLASKSTQTDQKASREGTMYCFQDEGTYHHQRCSAGRTGEEGSKRVTKVTALKMAAGVSAGRAVTFLWRHR